MPETCPNCGTPVRTTYRFCSACGALLTDAPKLSNPAAPESRSVAYGSPASEDATADSSQAQTPSAYAVRRWDSLADEVPSVDGNERIAESPQAYVFPTPQGRAGGSVAPYAGQSRPGPLARRAGALYTPYSPDAVKRIEKPRSERSWLIPVIIVCAVALVSLIGAGIYLNNIVASKVASDPAGPSGQQPSPADESAIRDVIRRSNADQIKSLKNLDTEVLKATRIGRALADDTAYVQKLKSSNMYADAVNDSLEILEVRVNGDNATAHTLETWNVTYYNKADNTISSSEGSKTLDEIYHLVKRDGKWLVSSVDIQEVPGSPGS